MKFKERLEGVHNYHTINAISSDEDGFFIKTADPIYEFQSVIQQFIKRFKIGKMLSKRKWGNKRIDQIQKRLYDMVLGTTTTAKDKPKSTLAVMKDLQKKTSDKDDKFSKNDFERVARTEIASTRAGFMLMTAKDAGYSMVKHETMNDAKVSKICKQHANKSYKVNYLLQNEQHRIPLHVNCFINSCTKITTRTGYKNIKDIKVGDEVLTHKNRFKKVTEIISGETKEYHKFIMNNNLLEVTGKHPIRILDAWKNVEDIKVGDNVKSNDKIVSDKLLRTYNFSVEDDESYIANGIVVHNCRCRYRIVRK